MLPDRWTLTSNKFFCFSQTEVKMPHNICQYYGGTPWLASPAEHNHQSAFSMHHSVIYSWHTHTHTSLMALCPGLPRSAGTRKEKPIWILLKQETVSGSGISWAICKPAPWSRQTTTPTPHHSVFKGQMSFLPPNQQRQSTEGSIYSWKWVKLKSGTGGQLFYFEVTIVKPA